MKKIQTKTISNKLAEINFLEQYRLGETKFYRAKLNSINLENQLLHKLELIEADFNYANLEKTILNDSDLSKSSLIEARLKAANLNEVNLLAANLKDASLSLAKLTKVNLTAACLTNVSFYAAQLNSVDLSFCNLFGAFFGDVDLSNVILKRAYYDDYTYLPHGFDPIGAGMVHKSCIESLDSIVARFNSICTISNRYLGNIITARFLRFSRPDFGWLEQFEIDRKNQIILTKSLPSLLTSQQLYYFETWINSFVKSCSDIVKNFPKFI